MQPCRSSNLKCQRTPCEQRGVWVRKGLFDQRIVDLRRESGACRDIEGGYFLGRGKIMREREKFLEVERLKERGLMAATPT